MKITFFSNYLNHLQTPFCEEMLKLAVDFRFVSTEELPDWRLESGYQDCSDFFYNLKAYADDKNIQKALKLGVESDIVIFGAAPFSFVKERLRLNKHTFIYSERLLKKGEWQLLSPRALVGFIRQFSKYRERNCYMLCTSAYLPNDLDWLFAFQKKRFKWGYFTEVKDLNIDDVIGEKPTAKMNILWAARFISWKHPELVVKLAAVLKTKGLQFHINMVGSGDLFASINGLIEKLKLTDVISLLGSLSNEEARKHMLNSNIFLLTSDRGEGWGVVLNEAMSAGCGVVSSHAAGATPYLINHEENGLVFESGNLESLVKETERFILDKALREKLSRNAYFSVKNLWSPERAAKNFFTLASSKLRGEETSINNGPGSEALRTKEGFWKKTGHFN